MGLERIVKASVLVLAFLNGCAIPEKPREYINYQATFYTKREILNENPEQNTTLIKYYYRNGIEAEVLYIKNNLEKSILINIKSDIKNVLVKNSPALITPSKASYKISFLDDKTYTREVKFEYNGSHVKVLINGTNLKVYVDEKEFPIPQPFNSAILKKAIEIEEDLSLPDKLAILDLM